MKSNNGGSAELLETSDWMTIAIGYDVKIHIFFYQSLIFAWKRKN